MKRLIIPIISSALLLFIVGCQPALLNPPRLATQEAQEASLSQPATPTTAVYAAPTPTGEPIVNPPTPQSQINPNPVIKIWVNETSLAHRQVLERMAADLSTNHGIHLEFIMVDDKRLPDLVETAVLSNTLPDLILHPVEFTVGWAERGVFDSGLSQQLLNQLGSNTFDTAAIDLVTNPTTQQIAALPNDGWQQILIYRQDWFNDLGLAPPLTYQDIISGAQAIYRSPTLSARTNVTNTLLSGLVIPTESDLVSTHHIFEQLAIANGCELIDEKGEVLINQPNCLDTFRFYRETINRFSPNDVQTDISALNAYLSGRTGLFIAPPTALVSLAGLDNVYKPACAECVAQPDYLVANSGLVTHFSGRTADARPANLGHVSYLGITRGANVELVSRFVNYWYTDGYLQWLAVEPERKYPMRHSNSNQQNFFIDEWEQLPIGNSTLSLKDLYGTEKLTTMTTDISNTPRWGLTMGQGELITTIHEDALIAIMLQELLSGYFNVEVSAEEAYQRVIDLIPNYAYHSEPESTNE